MRLYVTSPGPFLSTCDLAIRWQLSPRTLQRWRLSRKGPLFCRIGRAIRYRLEDITSFEALQASARDLSRGSE